MGSNKEQGINIVSFLPSVKRTIDYPVTCVGIIIDSIITN